MVATPSTTAASSGAQRSRRSTAVHASAVPSSAPCPAASPAIRAAAGGKAATATSHATARISSAGTGVPSKSRIRETTSGCSSARIALGGSERAVGGNDVEQRGDHVGVERVSRLGGQVGQRGVDAQGRAVRALGRERDAALAYLAAEAGHTLDTDVVAALL